MDNILVVRVSWRKRNVFYIRLPTRSIKSIKIFGLEESIPSGLQTGQLAPGYYQTFIIKPPNSFRETIKMGPPNKCIVRRAIFPFFHPMKIHFDSIHLSPPIFFHPRRKFAWFIKRYKIMNAFYLRVLRNVRKWRKIVLKFVYV